MKIFTYFFRFACDCAFALSFGPSSLSKVEVTYLLVSFGCRHFAFLSVFLATPGASAFGKLTLRRVLAIALLIGTDFVARIRF